MEYHSKWNITQIKYDFNRKVTQNGMSPKIEHNLNLNVTQPWMSLK